MKNSDFLQQLIFSDAKIRAEILVLKDASRTILSQHAYPAAVKTILAEALCIAGLLSATMKQEGRISLQFQGEGSLRLLLAQCTDQLNLRGLAKWQGDINQADIIASLSKGLLVITLDHFSTAKTYQGIVALKGHSLTDAIENYFKNSEQIPTKIILNVKNEIGVGMLLQTIPQKAQAAFDLNVWEKIISLTKKINLPDFINHPSEKVLQKFYPQETIELFTARSMQFQCTCTRERGEQAIALLGKVEAEEELEEKQVLTTTCEFCNKEYIFNREEVEKIFNNRKKDPHQLH